MGISKMRWAWDMKQRKRNACSDMVGKYEGKRTFGKHSGRRGNINIVTGWNDYRRGMDW
jgi:hypothetical protein